METQVAVHLINVSFFTLALLTTVLREMLMFIFKSVNLLGAHAGAHIYGSLLKHGDPANTSCPDVKPLNQVCRKLLHILPFALKEKYNKNITNNT